MTWCCLASKRSTVPVLLILYCNYLLLATVQQFVTSENFPKIRDGLDLRNNYKNVVILSIFEIFSKIARNAAETLDAEHRKETGNDYL